MSEKTKGLAQLLPGKNALNECNLEELQHLAKRYPFFAPAQFLLLQKLKENDSPDYETQYQKAVLYYPDPLQFEQFISADKFQQDETLWQEDKQSLIAPEEEPENLITPVEGYADIEQKLLQPEAETITSHDTTGESDDRNAATPIEVTQEDASLLVTAQPRSDAMALLTEWDKAGETEAAETTEPPMLPTHPLQDKMGPGVLQNAEAGTEAENGYSLPVIASPEVAALAKQISATENHPPAGTNAQDVAAAKDAVTAGPVLYEPFHTVDYFASQGIKITADELPKDKLSKQMRSFTEWLKVMKRLPAVQAEQSPQSSAEKNVANLASHSVQGGEVLTEAMAEVWAKQGAAEKAIETYNKLSLLNPSKKAYFAAKIENLSRS